jgi:hypothetical protein
VKRLTDLIDAKFLSTEHDYRPMDLTLITHIYTIDVVGDMTFGKPYGFLDEGKDIFGFLKWNDDHLPAALLATTLPSLSQLFQMEPLANLLPKASDPVGLGRFIRFV